MERLREEKLKKIVWAVDAFEMAGDAFEHCLDFARALSHQIQLEIQPTYVLSVGELGVGFEYPPPDLERYRAAAERRIGETLGARNLEGLLPPQVLVEPMGSLLPSVHAVSAHAITSGAQLILAGSHGRRGMKRLLLGSFAETLVLHSKVPVVIEGAHAAPSRGVRHLFLPTALEPRSRQLFKAAVVFARSVGARITLFHSVPNPVEPYFQYGVQMLGAGWLATRQFFDEEIAWRKRRVEGWAEWAKGQGVETRPLIDSKGVRIDAAILSLSRSERADVIMMASETGSIASALLGSVTRKVLRDAACPVWVLPAGATPKLLCADTRLKRAA